MDKNHFYKNKVIILTHHAPINISRLSIMLLRQILINKYHLTSTCDRYDSVQAPLFQLYSPCSSTLKYRPFKPLFVFTRVVVCAHSKDYTNQFITSVILNAPDSKADSQFLVNISCSGTRHGTHLLSAGPDGFLRAEVKRCTGSK